MKYDIDVFASLKSPGKVNLYESTLMAAYYAPSPGEGEVRQWHINFRLPHHSHILGRENKIHYQIKVPVPV